MFNEVFFPVFDLLFTYLWYRMLFAVNLLSLFCL